MKARWYFVWFFWACLCGIVGVCAWETWAYSHDQGIDGVHPISSMADGYAINGNYDTVHWRDGTIMTGNLKSSRIFSSGELIATVPYSKGRVEVWGKRCVDLQTFDVSEGQP
jgi:hypothetical protein